MRAIPIISLCIYQPVPLSAYRWVELAVRMLEASVRKGVTEGVASIAAQISWQCRLKLQRPALDHAKWKLEEAAAAVLPAQVREWRVSGQSSLERFCDTGSCLTLHS